MNESGGTAGESGRKVGRTGSVEEPVVEAELIRRVELQGLVVMKIVQRCCEAFPMTVAGQLLGMNLGEVLEITNCYPFPTSAGHETAGFDDQMPSTPLSVASEVDRSQYQMDMMRCVREVNVDHQVVGWYQSTGSQMGSFLSMGWIETQYSYQNNLRNVVCLVFDPVRTEEGTLSLHAYRLTDNFMFLWRKGDFSSLAFGKELVKADNLLEEVPILVRENALASAFLASIGTSAEFEGVNEVAYSRLEFSEKPILESTMEYIINDMDELGKEGGKYAMFVRSFIRQKTQQAEWLRRRKAENRNRKAMGQELLPEEEDVKSLLSAESSRLESKMLLKELAGYVDSIKTLASEYIVKQSVVGAVQSEE
mmetsp:Transcript_3816/g.7288  ORF Transcript_3816/g.7288 Transcript_3816/m.7288 type:complete len:366 (-) Transcript_3816:913-2010(-)